MPVSRENLPSTANPEDAAFAESHQQQVQRLREMRPDNWMRPPVPHAPCVRIKRTGEILPWTDGFADRSDLCEACDATGNTDPRAWGDNPVATAPAEPVPIVTDTPERAGGDIHGPDMARAVQKLGLDKNYAKDFTEPTTKNEALVIPPQKAENLSVNDVVQAVFESKTARRG